MNQRLVLPIAAGVVVVAAVIAVLLGPGLGGAGASPTPIAGSPSPEPTLAGPTDASALVITGTALATLQSPTNDVAAGRPAPVASGPSFDGSTVTIGEAGRPQVIIFLAHWCSHCQREVPVVQAWLDANGPPEGVDLRSVATGIDPTLPNYPPDAWLEAERWSVPVLVDPADTVASAYGLSGFPFWVFLDAEGRVALRASGELTIEQLEGILTILRGG